ncbi:choice-of-anchor I family protein [Pacificimonas flava]|uniref:Alkaline phosphatase n=1 Tax=Pacificimonas flava TaxID=1234595 RepID=M2TNZ7_9SPHN|nr:choice-of-anchor I family protein [Pacificimonas flava]EMD83466.1 Alkaline phosphatase [Pacificimonas flava]MBB5278975.1 2',3'-cyclic-nucleotide 2'-phosphodiesterase (5'-nucleotidase family) [Pacificimonas flava]
MNRPTFDISIAQVFNSGSGEAGSEVVATENGRFVVTNGAENRIDIFLIGSGGLERSIDLSSIAGFEGVQSVDIRGGVIAAAIARSGGNGLVATFDAETGEALAQYECGVLPDMVTFSKDGTRLFVANEGERGDLPNPADDAAPGSISVITLESGGVESFGFEAYDDMNADGVFDEADLTILRDMGIRTFPGSAPSLDFEPEYIAEGADGNLYVTLQEANAVAVFDLETMAFVDLFSAGAVDHSLPGNGIDPSDRDSAIDIHTVPVMGLRMPDAIATVDIGGETYFLTANEGDSRDFEEVRIKDVVLDPATFPNAAELQQDDQLGRLAISAVDGDTDGDGDYDVLYAYGSRSFTIFDATGNVVFNSGDDFEQIIAATRPPLAFNNDEFDPATAASEDLQTLDEDRSDAKGPEPEAIAVGQVGEQVYAFVGLERDSGIMIYDITNPHGATFVDYIDSAAYGHFAPEIIRFIPADESGNGQAQLAVSYEVSGTTAVYDLALTPAEQVDYTLQLLHFGDPEVGTLGTETAPLIAAMIDGFEESFANTLILSAGDNYIPGPFLTAGYLEGNGFPDIEILNAMGIDASAIGNHEFDLGTGVFADAVAAAMFPYISANLDVSGDSATSGLFTDTTATAGLELASALAGRIVPSAVVEEGGEQIGIVGATTQILAAISSIGGIDVVSGGADDMAALAAVLQPVIDDLTNQGVNKVVLVSHLQQIQLEAALAPLLEGVDIIVAGGSNTRLGDETDQAVAFPGHEADFAGDYPIQTSGADGRPTLIVNTDNEYTYLGRLAVDFDSEGVIITEGLEERLDVNGAYAATIENVAEAFGVSIEEAQEIAFAAGTKGGAVNDIIAPVQAIIDDLGGDIAGYTDVYLDGSREEVRTQETNLGNLTADANAAALRGQEDLGDNAVVVSIKNGGGIRAAIGTFSSPGPNGEVDELPPQPNGAVSALDIGNALRFDNSLIALDLTAEGLKAVLEYGVSGIAGATEGRFPQVGGVRFSFDQSLEVGSRVRDIALVAADGSLIPLFDDGELIAGVDPEMAITVVTLSFLAGGGDGYPFLDYASNFRYLTTGDSTAATQVTDGALGAEPENILAEQKAFADYLSALHESEDAAFDEEDRPIEQDTRIQNLAYRDDTVLSGDVEQVVGDDAANDLVGTDGDEQFFAGLGSDTITLGGGDDQIVGSFADHVGDTVSGFDVGDQLRIQEGDLTAFDLQVTQVGESYLVSGANVAAGGILLEGTFERQGFVFGRRGEEVTVAVDDVIDADNLVDMQAIAEELSVGMGGASLYLNGDNAADYTLTFENDLSVADFDNSLLAYEIGADGQIVDVTLLAANVKTVEGPLSVTDVDAGNQLHFALLQKGGDIDFDGALDIDVSSGEAVLTVDGEAVDRSLLVSHDAALNVTGIDHVLSGTTGTTEGDVRIAFEDQTVEVDADYQDIVFTVEAMPPAAMEIV